MTPDDVRAAAEQLLALHRDFAPLFGKDEAQLHSHDYLKGLLVCPGRKSVEPIATMVGHGDVSGLQKFLNSGPWPYDDVQDEIQATFAIGMGAPEGTGLSNPRIVDFPNNGHPVRITFTNGKATDIQAGS